MGNSIATYRPVKLSVTMFFEKSRPHQDIPDLNTWGHPFGIGLARSHSTENTILVINSTRSHSGRSFTPYDVENVLKVRSVTPDLINDTGISVVKSMLSTISLDKFMVLFATGRQDPETIGRRNLDSVKTNARCLKCQGHDRHFPFGRYLQLPPQMRTDCFCSGMILRAKDSFENRPRSAVHDARGTVHASSGERVSGTGKHICSSAMVYSLYAPRPLISPGYCVSRPYKEQKAGHFTNLPRSGQLLACPW